MDVSSGTTELGDGTLQSSHSLLHQASACYVVCVAVGVNYQKNHCIYHQLKDLILILGINLCNVYIGETVNVQFIKHTGFIARYR